MYETVIGIEIHVELNTKTKMFCGCLNNSDEKIPNLNICPVCTAQPGTLPVINEEAVRKVIKAGLALSCEIAQKSKFDRKNYFYPDLPKGYQISQYDMPFCEKGFLNIDGKKIRITRIHLEEDTGRLIHSKDTDYSLIDFNRAGIPLMELVTEPDITSGEQAKKFGQELQLIFRYLNISEANMEKGEFRVEANISLRKKGEKKFGTKVEIKNLNSFRAVEKGIEYEVKRQEELLKKGEKIVQETRGWDDNKEITFSQRIKEEAHDYRYFTEPDLPPIFITKQDIDSILSEIPELPAQKRIRLEKEYKLEDDKIEAFIQDKALGEYLEKVISEFGTKKKKDLLSLTKLGVNYLTTDLKGLLQNVSIKDVNFLITPENFAEFIILIYEDKISSKIAKIVLEEMYKTGGDPSQIVKEKGLILIDSEVELEEIIQEVLSRNEKTAEDYKKGKKNVLQFLIGQVMAKTAGRANPKAVEKILKRILE